MLSVEEVVELISYLVGGVCLFGLFGVFKVYCDVFLKVFDVVIFVVGVINVVVWIVLQCMVEIMDVEWVDVCQLLVIVV